MRLPHHSDIVGLILGVARSVSSHPQCGVTQERDKGAANGQAQKNRRLDRSSVDNRNHSICHFCLGVQTCSFAVIIHPKERGFQRPMEGIVTLVEQECGCALRSTKKTKSDWQRPTGSRMPK